MAEEELQNSVSISQSPRQPHDVTWRTWVQRSPGSSFPFPCSSAICQNAVSRSPLTAEGDGDDLCWPQEQHGGRWAQPSSRTQAAWVPTERDTGLPPRGVCWTTGKGPRVSRTLTVHWAFQHQGYEKRRIPAIYEVGSRLPRWLSG